ncbi:MAG: hypothetical protein PVJ84_20140 [Desulfobacteraceae bacterium]|jgi:hypothetical protein
MTLTLKMCNANDSRLGGGPMSKVLTQLNIDELNQLSEQIEADPEKAAGLLFPENPSERLTLAKKISQWAINQTLVKESFQNNKADLAFIFEKVCNRIWSQLPTYARSVRVNLE